MHYKSRKERGRIGDVKKELGQVVVKPKVGTGAWVSLVISILILLGAFRTGEFTLEAMDLTNLCENSGQIGETGADSIGRGGSDIKDGLTAGLDLTPAAMLFCGIMGAFEQLGVLKTSDILFRLILKPTLNIPGECGVVLISSFTGSDVAVAMTRELADSGELSDDGRTVSVAYQYAGFACINNTITRGIPLIAICPVTPGPVIVIEFVCKLVGADLVRLTLKISQKKGV